ncbi:phage tail protein [Paenibacillus yanchengensis]|uniref:Phage tail protein n=1 Tax=Paenibacillus yanchengensis TaxID=2035833 RepID=A0ABW4YEW8_9BACL
MGKRTFFSFRSSVDWKRGWQAQLTNDAAALAIEKENVYRQCHTEQIVNSRLTASIIDTTTDVAGKWYVLDDARNIWRLDTVQHDAERMIQLEGDDQLQPVQLAAAAETMAVLYSTVVSTIAIMQINGAQIRAQITDWYGEKFTGYAIAADRQGGWLVIATLAEQTALQLLRFDRFGMPTIKMALDDYFRLDENVTSSTSERAAQQGQQFQIVFDMYDNCWILQHAAEQIISLDLTTNYVVSQLQVPIVQHQQQIVSIGSGQQNEQHILWILVREQTKEQQLSLIGLNEQSEVVQRGYVNNSTADRMVVSKQAVFLWDGQEKLLTRVEPVLEPAVWELTSSRSGVWISYALDSGENETIWHRLTMEAHVPHDCQVNIRYYASDQREIWAGDKRVVLDEWLQDSSTTEAEKLAVLQPYWSKPLRDPQDALLRHATGRYLWIHLELLGSAHHTPTIQLMKVFFPRQSYMQYLPSIYEQTAGQDQFLERYLTLFQTMLEEVDDDIGGITRRLQVNQASGPSLRWLLQWLGIESDDFWSDEQLRQLLKEAPQLYALRGTKQALMRLIEIYTGERPIILEYEQIKPLKENVDIGEVADRLYAADPHTFNVLVKAEHVTTELKRVTLQQLIEAYKPAFASFKLIILQPWVYIDLHSYLGMNTILSEPTLLTLDNQSSMPHHTITIDTSGENRMDQHTRLGLNARLE